MSSEPMLTAAELAAHYGVTAGTIRIRAQTGAIPGHRLSARSQWRFDLEEVREATKPSEDIWAQPAASVRARRKR